MIYQPNTDISATMSPAIFFLNFYRFMVQNRPCFTNMARMGGGRLGIRGFRSDEEKEECRDQGKGPWGCIVEQSKCNNPKSNGGGYFDGITFCHFDSNNSSPQVPPTSPTYSAPFPSIFNYSYFLYHLMPYFYMQFQLYVTYSFS